MIADEVERAVAAIPAPQDGKGITVDDVAPLIASEVEKRVGALPKAQDGKDGVGFDDMDLVETDEGLVLRFVRADKVRDFRLPVVVDRGVFKDGQVYRPGDGVTWGGSFWICREETTDKPDSGKGFRLAVKKGRDGRDAGAKETKPSEPVRVGVPARAVS